LDWNKGGTLINIFVTPPSQKGVDTKVYSGCGDDINYRGAVKRVSIKVNNYYQLT
jgi:hypothetical protein